MGLVREFHGVQSQIADLVQFHARSSANLDQDGREREEVMSLLNNVTNDVRNQNPIVTSGLTAQKEQQQKTEAVLTGIRNDLETVIAETGNLRVNMANNSQ